MGSRGRPGASRLRRLLYPTCGRTTWSRPPTTRQRPSSSVIRGPDPHPVLLVEVGLRGGPDRPSYPPRPQARRGTTEDRVADPDDVYSSRPSARVGTGVTRPSGPLLSLPPCTTPVRTMYEGLDGEVVIHLPTSRLSGWTRGVRGVGVRTYS